MWGRCTIASQGFKEIKTSCLHACLHIRFKTLPDRQESYSNLPHDVARNKCAQRTASICSPQVLGKTPVKDLTDGHLLGERGEDALDVGGDSGPARGLHRGVGRLERRLQAPERGVQRPIYGLPVAVQRALRPTAAPNKASAIVTGRPRVPCTCGRRCPARPEPAAPHQAAGQPGHPPCTGGS